MAHELGVTYTLTGPDGTVCVFQDPTDPNFVGYLNEIGGLDSAEVRENFALIPEGDGGIHGNFWRGRRPVSLDGFIVVDADTASQRNARVDKLLRVTNLALRDDAVLKWTESGSIERQITLRCQQPTRITGKRPKNFLVAMVAANPRIVGTVEQSVVIAATGTVTGEGFNFPMDWDLDFQEEAGAAGSDTVTNNGNGPAVPRFRIDGPIQNPRIRNETTGEELRINYTLVTGEYLIVDAADRTIKLGGTVDRYSALDFANSEWWELQPGANDVRLFSTSYSTPAAVTVYYRHTWV